MFGAFNDAWTETSDLCSQKSAFLFDYVAECELV